MNVGSRSFVTRAGCLSIAQARALEELGPKFSIEYAKAPLDFEQAFGRKAISCAHWQRDINRRRS